MVKLYNFLSAEAEVSCETAILTQKYTEKEKETKKGITKLRENEGKSIPHESPLWTPDYVFSRKRINYIF